MTDPMDTVLVADDSEGTRALLTAMLSRNGWRVLLAEDGRQALEIFHREAVDLVILDVVMPAVGGLEVCRTIKADEGTRLVPVVIITGLQASEDRIQGIRAGADDFITKPFVKEEVLARLRALLRLKHFTDDLDNAETVLFSLAMGIEAKDPYTGGHCDRLSHYSVALGRKLGLVDDLCVALRRAGIVHDIGKVAVPDSILLKPGPLTPEERRVIEQHPVTGERICAPLKSFRHVLPIIRHHHERLDGSGYPDGLGGAAVPLTAQVLSVVDVYDALSTDRPYRAALSPADAFQILRAEAARGWRDAALVEAFEQVLMEAGEPA